MPLFVRHSATAYSKVIFILTNVIHCFTRCSLPSGQIESSMEVGSVPVHMPMRPLKIHSAMYSHGLFLAGLEKENEKGDDFLCLFEDLAGRNAAPTVPATGTATVVYPSQSPSMREGICIPHTLSGLPAVTGKIHDIKESCAYIHSEVPSVLQSLCASSSTGNGISFGNQASHFYFISINAMLL